MCWDIFIRLVLKRFEFRPAKGWAQLAPSLRCGVCGLHNKKWDLIITYIGEVVKLSLIPRACLEFVIERKLI